MDSNLLIVAIVFALLLAGTLAWLLIRQRRELKKLTHPPGKSGQSADAGRSDNGGHGDPAGIPSRQLQLQAYERLLLLADRIALPNLIQRVNQPGLSAREMQSLLTLSIRQEFEHNITQQIFVTPEAWEVIRNYKDQNTLIINQIASFLPEDASGNDLNRGLLDLLVQNPKASLQNVVSEALSFEAKKLL
ncbi:MAG TPA: hypothetical protein VMH27_08470 [Puia sp.]|nr:hypothetical protein [Puia sp.]